MKTIKIPNLKFPQWDFENNAVRYLREWKDSEKLNKWIEENEKSFRERKFVWASGFLIHFFKLAKKLTDFSNKEKSGLRAAIHADYGKFPSAYYRKGTPLCSQIIVEFKSGKWNILSFERVPVPETEIQIFTLPEKAREKIIKLFCNF